MNMQLGPKGIALIQSFEQLRLVSYQDQHGVWTIAWGHTLGVVPYQTCTREDADAWFIQDTGIAVRAVNASLTVPVSQEEFDALVSFTYNVGIGSEAHSTLVKLLDAGNVAAAADEFPKWNHVDGVPNAGLTRRRAAERDLFLSVAA